VGRYENQGAVAVRKGRLGVPYLEVLDEKFAEGPDVRCQAGKTDPLARHGKAGFKLCHGFQPFNGAGIRKKAPAAVMKWSYHLKAILIPEKYFGKQ
jgi:hypothetical protein